MRWKLKMMLAEAGMNQAQLAKKIGVSEAVISYIVRGKREPSERVTKRIADVLGVKPNEICDCTKTA